MHFEAAKKSKNVLIMCIYSNRTSRLLTAVKRDAKFLGILFVNRRYTKGVPFLSKMVY